MKNNLFLCKRLRERLHKNFHYLHKKYYYLFPYFDVEYAVRYVLTLSYVS